LQPHGDDKPLSIPGTGRRREVCGTILTALIAPVLVFAALVALTSDRAPREFAIDAWRLGGRRLVDSGAGLTFPVGLRPTFLSPAAPPPAAPFARLDLEVYLRRPLELQAGLLYRLPAGKREDLRAYDFSLDIRKTGWNPVTISADDAAGLEKAEAIRLSLISLQGPNVAGIRNARLRSYSYGARAGQMLAALFRHEPLVPASVNFQVSQRVAGRGFSFLLWGALPLAAAGLLLRRFLLRERFRLLPHAALTLLVLFVLADLRNSTDAFLNARTAAARQARAPSIDAYLRQIERATPWLPDTARFLRETLPSGQRYYLHFGRHPLTQVAARRAAYYAWPARRTFDVQEARLILSYGRSVEPFEQFRRWRRVGTLPGGVVVNERVR
jgi:hypothetical protein